MKTYYIVSTYNQDMLPWFIVTGPFPSRKEAESQIVCRDARDLYAVTEFRNALAVTFEQMARLRRGIPRRRIGDDGRWAMFEAYEARQAEGQELIREFEAEGY